MKRIIRKPKAQTLVLTPNTSTFIPCEDQVGAMLLAHSRRKEPSRLGGDWLHVSALLGGDCLRAYLLANQQGIRAETKPRAADRILWAIGKTVEAHIRESMIDLYGAANCYGRWKCACGKSERIGTGADGSSCDKCRTPYNKYDEVNLRDEDTRLTGSPDFLIRPRPKAPWTVTEIKSIKVVPKGGVRTSAPDFHSVETPSRSHSLQALMYRKLMQLLKVPVTDNVLVVYGAKDYVVGSPYKVFSIDALAEENVMAIDHLFDAARPFGEAVRKKTLVPRLAVCANPNTTRAKACPCSVQCFASRK